MHNVNAFLQDADNRLYVGESPEGEPPELSTRLGCRVIHAPVDLCLKKADSLHGSMLVKDAKARLRTYVCLCVVPMDFSTSAI